MTARPRYLAESPELRLMLAATAWPQTEDDRCRIREILAAPFDTGRFLELVQHHRVAPLVARNLHTSPQDKKTRETVELGAALHALASANGFRALRSLAELRRLTERMGTAGIPVRVLKGVPLAQEIFGDPSLRAAGDIDLLVPEEALVEADRILREEGYEGLFDLQRFSPRQLGFYRAHWKDNAYRNAVTAAEVDLHWRCFRNREMPGAKLCETAATDTVSFGSFQTSTLPWPENLLYLCVHGTLDGWIYLKSLADVCAAVRPMHGDGLDALAESASAYGVLPELSAALILVRRYFGMECWSSRLLDEQDATVAHILRFAARWLEGGRFLVSREDVPVRAVVAFELGLRRDVAYRKELLLRILFRARMWQTIPLPDALFGLYPLLSPFEWLSFRWRRRKAKP